MDLLDIFCLPIRSIVRRTSSHLLSYRSSKLRFLLSLSPNQATSQSLLFVDIFVRLTSTLSASQVNLIQKLRRVLKINSFDLLVPHRIQIVFLSCHFDVAHTHGRKESLLSMNTQAFPFRCFLPSVLKQDLLELSLPEQSSKAVSAQMPFERNHRVMRVLPCFCPLVSQ